MAVSSPSTLLLFLLLVFSPSSALLSHSGVSPEVKTLLTIKSFLEDPQGVLNWDVSSMNPCTWTFVTCSPELFVIGLEAPGQNLSGRLSPSIGNLTNLESLLLQTNNITGPIPAEIGKLAKVMKLNLSRNHLYGEIPSSVPHLGRLQYLDLSYNNLSGPVPRFFAGTLNIVGNPLMCGVNTGQDCSGTAPVPMSSNLEISQASLPTAKTKTHKFAVVLGYMIACVIILWFPIS
ncbi:unnamed protein product [Urochloa decumbens]|uniref:Leucine-rich repeat-containing N-terminal plant-type domain-containing protein n=1 Tax=Urochloa decumbens TaxID=240449 RepID=A0ABC9DPU3_9POAL